MLAKSSRIVIDIAALPTHPRIAPPFIEIGPGGVVVLIRLIDLIDACSDDRRRENQKFRNKPPTVPMRVMASDDAVVHEPHER
jgi:hypothetical protein